jgi:hypothetical protein
MGGDKAIAAATAICEFDKRPECDKFELEMNK